MAQPPTDAQILQKLWPDFDTDYCYLSFYDSLLRQVKGKLSVIDRYYPNITPNDILSIIEEVRRSKDEQQGALIRRVKDKLSSKIPSDDAINDAIREVVHLAIYLWLTVNIEIPPASGIVLSSAIQWDSSRSLSEQLRVSFQDPTNGGLYYSNETGRLDALTMANLVYKHDLVIDWTSDLAEHLRMSSHSNRRYLKVYEHKICLRNHLNRRNDTALPREILEEAIDTLNLLFRYGERQTQSLLKKKLKNGESFYDLATCGRDLVLETSGYKYWRVRIEVLNRVLDEPPSWRAQFALEKGGRNALQFFTFWIATFVAVFTIVSFALGVVSAVYAQKAYDIALIQYELSLAQACAVPDNARLLPRFCS